MTHVTIDWHYVHRTFPRLTVPSCRGKAQWHGLALRLGNLRGAFKAGNFFSVMGMGIDWPEASDGMCRNHERVYTTAKIPCANQSPKPISL